MPKRNFEMETNPIVSDVDGSTGTETVMGVIVKEIFIEAPPNIVCDFLTDPKKLARWVGVLSGKKRSKGRKRGKKLVIAIQRGPVQKVLNSKVVFRWKVYAMGTTVRAVIEIDLEKRGNGTWVRLTHKELRRISGKRVREAACQTPAR